MDGDIRVLAFVYCDAGHDTSYIVWSNNNEMITSTIFGIILSVIAPSDTAVDPASVIYKGLITTGKIIEKTEKKEWEASAHEEIYQMTKDSIYKMGGLK